MPDILDDVSGFFVFVCFNITGDGGWGWFFISSYFCSRGLGGRLSVQRDKQYDIPIVLFPLFRNKLIVMLNSKGTMYNVIRQGEVS